MNFRSFNFINIYLRTCYLQDITLTVIVTSSHCKTHSPIWDYIEWTIGCSGRIHIWMGNNTLLIIKNLTTEAGRIQR